MKPSDSGGSTVTTSTDARITGWGAILRRFKLDELPQLVNVIKGEMALLGPRPDVVGFADELRDGDRVLLDIRPGITGPASVLLRDEEELLAQVDEPEQVNAAVLYPLKTVVNLAWVENGSLFDDLKLLVWTVIPPRDQAMEGMLLRWNADCRAWPEIKAAESLGWLSFNDVCGSKNPSAESVSP